MAKYVLESENLKDQKIINYYLQEYTESGIKIDKIIVARYFYSKNKSYGFYRRFGNNKLSYKEYEVKKCKTLVNNLIEIAQKNNIEVLDLHCIETYKNKDIKKKEIKETGEIGYKIFNRCFNSKMEAIEYCNRNDFLIEFIEEIAM